MNRFGNPFGVFLICIICICLLPSAAISAAPNGVKDMLKKAAETNNKANFVAILSVALETWPDQRMASIIAAEQIKPYWVSDTLLDELDASKKAAVAAEKASKARGVVYYLDPELWNAKFQLGAGTSSGDTDENAVSAGMNFKRSFGANWEHELDIGIDFASSGGITTRQRFVAKYETLWRPWKSGFLLNYTELELDRFSGFDYRVIENIGAGVDVFDTGLHKFRLEGGPGVRFSQLKETGLTETEYLGRISSTYDIKLSGDLTLKDKSAVIFASESITFENTAQFNAKLNSHLAARLSLEVKYDSNAPDATSPWDTATRATLVYGF